MKILVFSICLAFLLGFYFFIQPSSSKNKKDSQYIPINNTDHSHIVTNEEKTYNISDKNQDDIKTSEVIEESSFSFENEKNTYPIHIMGQVKSPGVYYLQKNMIVQDAIDLAGGLTEQADILLINLAEQVTAHQKIYIPSKEELEQNLERYSELISKGGMVSNTQASTDTNSSSTLININTASFEELQNLTGIGPSKAQSIIEYREQIGNFSSLEELMNVPGIKENSFQKIKDCISLE